MADDTPPAPTWPRALIFDLDGTLIDSAPDIANAVATALAEHAVVIDAAEVRRYIGDGARKLIERVLAARGIDYDADGIEGATEVFNRHYQAQPCQDTTCYPGVREMLSACRAEGRKLAICTNKPQAVAEEVLRALRLDDAIDLLIGAGIYRLKPDPQPLQACLERLGIDVADAVYVGDMAVDRDAARAAGLPVVLARFGYAQDDVAGFSPDAVLDAWRDWPDVERRLATVRGDETDAEA